MPYPKVDIVSCDFNKDGVVNANDLLDFNDHWGAYARKYDSNFDDVVAEPSYADYQAVFNRLYPSSLNIATIRSNIRKDVYETLTWPNSWSAALVGVNPDAVSQFMGQDSGVKGWITVHEHPYWWKNYIHPVDFVASDWANKLYAYNGDYDNQATYPVPAYSWSPYLTLITSDTLYRGTDHSEPKQYQRVQVWGYCNQATIHTGVIDLYYEGAWHNILDGELPPADPDKFYFNYPDVDDKVIEQIRMKFYNSAGTEQTAAVSNVQLQLTERELAGNRSYCCRHFAHDSAIAAYKALGYGVLFYVSGGGHAYNGFWTGLGSWQDWTKWQIIESETGARYRILDADRIQNVDTSVITDVSNPSHIYHSNYIKFYELSYESGGVLTLKSNRLSISGTTVAYSGYIYDDSSSTRTLEEVPVPTTFDPWLGLAVLGAPTNVSATDGDYTDKVIITWERSSGATQYQVYRDGVGLGWLGDVDTYNDTEADAPFIIAGSAVASDGDDADFVRLSLSGQSVHNGTTHTYKVKAKNTAGESSDSDTDTGYRGHGELAYQWQRSSGDADSGYSNINGANTAIYYDMDAPGDGSGRYYKCIEYAEGAASATSTADRGYRSVGGRYTRTATVSLGLKAIGSFLPSGYQTETLRPNALGDEENIALENPLGEDHYTLVNEAEPDVLTFVREVVGWNRDLYNIEDHSVGSGSISHITVYARARSLISPIQTNLKICIKSNTTITEDTERTLTTSYANYSKQWSTNPADGQPWEWADIDVLQIGISLRESGAGNPFVLCTQVYVEIEYTTEPLHYTRSYTALLGLLSIASRINVLTRGEIALLGLKAIASRTVSRIRTDTALLGLKATATRALSLGRIKTALLGLKPIGVRLVAGNLVREGIVYLGLKTIATRGIVLTFAETALLGLKAIASRATVVTRAGVALLGLKAIAIRVLAESVRKVALTVKFFSKAFIIKLNDRDFIAKLYDRAVTILARTRRR